MHMRSVQLNLPMSRSLDIEFENVYFAATTGLRSPMKTILKGASGRFKAGELTAIMGLSGAGKSTLLNILTGFQRTGWTGKVEYIGNDGKQSWSEYRKESCYIQQDDQLQPLFTVLETMMMAVNLKIGSNLSQKAKEMLVDDILDTLDLNKARNTRCGKVSGGQRKRLSIALELIDNPPVMFLDEPTTGLDALSTYQCVKVLQSLTRGGRTIVCTIHQPSAVIYEMFDHVYLLADGRCMYQGAASKTVQYFGNVGLQCPKYHNPADYMIEVVSMEYGNFNDQLALMATSSGDMWRANVSPRKEKAEEAEAKTTILINHPSEYMKLWILLNRCMVQLYRDWTVTHLKLALHVFVGILLGLMYAGMSNNGAKTVNNVGFFLINVVYLTYTSMMPAVLKFPTELEVLRKERFNNWYQLRTYYTAIILTGVPVQILLAVAHTSLSFFISNQSPDVNRYLMFVGISILTSLVSESIGLLIGTIFNTINGTFVGAILTCILLAFAGFLVLFNHMPIFLYYISYFSYLKYAIHGQAESLYGYDREKLPCPKPLTYCHFRAPKLVMETFSLEQGKYWTDIGVLSGYLVFFRLATYYTLKRRLAQF